MTRLRWYLHDFTPASHNLHVRRAGGNEFPFNAFVCEQVSDAFVHLCSNELVYLLHFAICAGKICPVIAAYYAGSSAATNEAAKRSNECLGRQLARYLEMNGLR